MSPDLRTPMERDADQQAAVGRCVATKVNGLPCRAHAMTGRRRCGVHHSRWLAALTAPRKVMPSDTPAG